MKGEVLPSARAAHLYREGYSVCEIHDMYPRITRRGVVYRLRDEGVGGLTWCPVHRTFERVELNPDAGLDRHHEA
jgi:hypothetical protein